LNQIVAETVSCQNQINSFFDNQRIALLLKDTANGVCKPANLNDTNPIPAAPVLVKTLKLVSGYFNRDLDDLRLAGQNQNFSRRYEKAESDRDALKVKLAKIAVLQTLHFVRSVSGSGPAQAGRVDFPLPASNMWRFSTR